MRTEARAYSRREAALLFASAGLVPAGPALASAKPSLVVHKDPNCGCCNGWVEHLHR